MLLGFLYCFSVSSNSPFGRRKVVLLVDFQCSQEHLEFDHQTLPPSKFLNMETQVEQLHLPVKALVFYETPLPHGRSHLY